MMKNTFKRDRLSWKILFITLPTMSTKLSFPVIQLSKLENYQQIVSEREEGWAQIVTDERDESSFTPAFWIIFHLLQNFRFVSFDSKFPGFVFRKCGFRLLKGAAGASFTPGTCLLGPVWRHFKPGHQHFASFSKWIFILCPEIMFDFFPMRESKLLWWCSYS